ncbi:ClpX, ATPase regulatory subunit, partial [Martensiomyces pterosporus]
IMRYLDEYVIGQERAKKTLAVAVYNHYNRVRANTLKRQREQLASSASSQPDASQKGQLKPPPQPRQHPPAPAPPSALESSILDTQLEKSNVLLLGPTGSGKTLLAKTLAQILDVPFSVSDATPLTQAGYVGEDVEVVIQRLMQSCDYDVARAEQGIVFIDEIDKIARKPDSFSMSKDVSGEGVQQGLLRMLEGTIVTITDKSGHSGSGSGHPGPPSPFPPHGMGSAPQAPPPGLAPSNLGGEVYHVDTSNILFILSGAFVGLDRLVMERVAKASIGFGNPVRKIGDTSTPVDLKAMNVAPVSFAAGSEAGASSTPFNPLDYTEPSDLIKFGLIPEFIGRLPVVTSVGALDKDSLVRVLVEPKNALVRQYEALLALSSAQLHITKPALYTIAQQAIDKQTGARGLRRIMENLLLEPMFDCPGSSIRHIVIDSEVAAFKKRPLYFSKIQEADVEAAIWNDEHRSEPSPKMQQQQQQQAGGAEKKRSIASSA